MKKTIKILLLVGIILSGLGILYFAIFPFESPYWMGFVEFDKDLNRSKGKTLWDWLELLVVPSTLGIIGWLYRDHEKIKEEKKNKEQKSNQILDSYFAVIEKLIINDSLLDPTKNQKSKIIARIRTYIAVDNLDGERKGQIIQFLYESNLISKNKVIELFGANFKKSNLQGIVLKKARINGAYFQNSNLSNSFLDNSNFVGCTFENSSFSNSSLENTDLSYTDLRNCELRDIDLSTVNFEGAKLNNADLRGSKIMKSQYDSFDQNIGIKIDYNKVVT